MIQDPNAQAFMRRALDLAQQGPFSDNPRVGAVIVSDGGIVGEGFHRGAGTAHAEVVAINSAGHLSRNATLYVSLEPCSHHGRTPPCTDAIIEAGIARVIYSQSDPTDIASGGHQVLEQAGVEVIGGVCVEESRAVNREWVHWITTGMPFVTWKSAQSLDSRVSSQLGKQTALSSDLAQESTHELRSSVDAIVVGTNTAVIDNPTLTARLSDGQLHENQPLRVVIGKRDLPAHAKLQNTEGGRVLHFRSHQIQQVLRELADMGVKHILLEGGPTLAGAFLSEGQVHRIVTVIAPVTFGSGPLPLARVLEQGYDVEEIHVEQVGSDLVISGTPVPR